MNNMKTYLKLQFNSEGASPSVIIKKLERLGWKPIMGEYDFVMEAGFGEGVGMSFREMLDDVNEALKGTNTSYSLYSFP